MIRFILNFILFGFIFFLLWQYAPQAFEPLVNFATAVWGVIVDVFHQIADRISQSQSLV